MEQSVSALNKGLTIGDNFAGEIRSITVDGIYPIKLAYRLKSPPRVVLLGSCKQMTGALVPITAAREVLWEFTSDGAFQVNSVLGISPSASIKYELEIVILIG